MPANTDELIPTRKSLLGRLHDWQDHASWKDFFDIYSKLIHGVAIKTGLSDAEAQEVVTETMMSVAKTMPGFKYDPEVCSFKSWLRHVTEKRIADQFRQRRREVSAKALWNGGGSSAPELEHLPDVASSGLEAIWDEEWKRNLLQTALQKLQLQVNAGQYQIFYLHVIQEMPAREVGASVGVSVGQVYLVKHRLSRLFKKALKNVADR